MEYSRLVAYYLRLEATRSRLEMTDILVELMEEVPPDLLARVVYLTLGKLGPDYLDLTFGIADRMVIRALAFTTGFNEDEVFDLWKRTGDPGDAVEDLLARKKQRSLFSTPLTVERVYDTFIRLAGSSGKGTQDVRTRYLAELLHDADPSSGKYIVRTVVGRLRLGVATMTLIDALAVSHIRRDPAYGQGGGCGGMETGYRIQTDGEVQGTTEEVQGATGEVQGTTGEVQGTTEEVQGTTEEVQGTTGKKAGSEDKINARLRPAMCSGDEVEVVTEPEMGTDNEPDEETDEEPDEEPDEGTDEETDEGTCEGTEIESGKEADGATISGSDMVARADVGTGGTAVRPGGQPMDEPSIPPSPGFGIPLDEKRRVRERIETAYNIHPDIGTIAEAVATGGMGGIHDISMEVGVPVRVMLAERLSSAEAILGKFAGKAAFEYKYDGIRIQAHVGEQGVTLFTRQQENVTSQFPDVVSALSDLHLPHEVIMEGECVPVDVNTGEILPFQMVSRRRGRKYDIENAMREFPVVLVLFDILYMDGKPLTDLDFPGRRQILESTIHPTDTVRLSVLRTLSDPREVDAFFLQSLDGGCEGLIAKSIAPDSFYRAGARGWQWIKFKRDYRSELADTLDLVAVGGFHGRGRRAGRFGALLMAAYDPGEDRFETVCKLGSGFDDEFLETMNSLLTSVPSRPRRVHTLITPDVWLEPDHVFEVLGAELTLSPTHTCARDRVKDGAGIAVRFPRYTGALRTDKAPGDATTTEEIVRMYLLQGGGSAEGGPMSDGS